MLNPAIESFVRDKADGVGHSGRTFYQHLRGTYDLLDGAPDYVRLAGLCHSIYGTNAFKRAVIPMSMRSAVRDVIGDDAERLAFIFCSCNRPIALIRAAKQGAPYFVLDRHSKRRIDLSPQDLSDLLWIEMANLTEQESFRMLSEVQHALIDVRGCMHV